MYTATLKAKEAQENGSAKVTVEFSDGVTTVIESVVVQDKRGYYHWVQSRLESLNESKDLLDNEPVDTEVPIPTAPEPDPAVVERIEWFNNYELLKKADELVDAGIIPAENAKLEALRTKVKADFKPEYLNLV